MNTQRANFLLFGDSLTQRSFHEGGWGSRLAALHERTADVVQRGYWGYNSRWAIQLLPHVFPEGEPVPSLVTILLGSNDAVMPDLGKSESKQHVPIKEFKKNLKKIIMHIRGLEQSDKAHPTCSITLITPPPIDHDRWQQHRVDNFVPTPPSTRNRCNERTRLYAEAVVQVGIETNTQTIDLYTKWSASHQWQDYLEDGLHLNPLGNKMLFDALAEVVHSSFPHLRPDVLKPQFPSFAEIDPDEFETAFRY
mmetsp:Transcript_26388/g.50125  ORF Transcript_26388/g.50125 Transcript_26388/m.50125 type:complete len:251 (+) Transcript_26388:70-822(+)